MKDVLSTREVARALNVGPSTVKRWADEGVLPCIRTSGGHRRFRVQDVERLRTAQTRSGSQDALVDRWLELLAADTHPQTIAAALLSDRAESGAWWHVADELGAVLEAIGERWCDGRFSILDEHLVSDRLNRALSWVAQAMPVTAGAPTALLATVEGDDHTLGLSLAELVAREAGWNVRWVGSRTPTTEVVQRLSTGDIDMVALSASAHSTDSEALAGQIRALAEPAAQHEVALVWGGAGAWPEEPEAGRHVEDFATFHELLRALALAPASAEPQ
jgi:excisionase family DNA binding protein